MKTIYTLLIISLSFTFYSSAQDKEVSLYLNHYYNGETLDLDDTLSFDDGRNYKISRLEYYLNINTLRATNGDSIVYPGEFYTAEDDLINYSGKQLLINTEKHKYALGFYEISDLNAMEFHIGVPQEINLQDPAIWPTSHALAPKYPSMHWGWAAGYRFLALEAMIDKDSDGLFEFPLNYHAVGDALYRSVNQTISTVETESEIIIYLDVNYEKLFTGNNTSAGGIFHGAQEQVVGIMDNFATNNVFTNTANLRVTKLALSNKITPNPFSNYLRIEIEEPSTIKVYSLLGKLVYQAVLSVGTTNLNTAKFKTGIYMVQIETKNSINSLKLIKI
tara:strand:+ start:193 stop:1191 length:999 start_codon:yes stop_codon:yes gene_type:complete